MSQTNSGVRCRFAPSPTGMLHVGGARTALFNYLFARANKGKYLLRVEDSDRQRSTPEAVEAIMKGLEWLGITPDEDIVFQSERTERYLEVVQSMLASGDAYRCTMSMEELDALREEQKAKGLKPRYDGRCRPAEKVPQDTTLPNASQAESFVIRIRMPEAASIDFDDAILGPIMTPTEELDDFILIRSDGTPTYNLVNAVDDIDMGITHVLRGNEHVANTPKQIIVYQAIGAPLPVFAHFPLILGADKKKLSKRHGATAVFQYRDDGYLADGFVNYLARLGWSAGDKELFTRDELEKEFDLAGVGKSPSIFDVDKLRWVNGEHMLRASVSSLVEQATPFFPSFADKSRIVLLTEQAGNTLTLEVCQRSKTLVELAEGLQWVLLPAEHIEVAEKDAQKAFKAELASSWSKLITRLSEVEEFRFSVLESEFTEFLASESLSFGKLGQAIRLALTGEKGGVAIFLAMEVLGKEETLTRLERAKSYF